MKRQTYSYRHGRRLWPWIWSLYKLKATSTYGVGAARLGVHRRMMGRILGAIQYEMDQQGRPPYQALVANEITRLPGKGYVGGGSYKRDLKHIYASRMPKKPTF